MPTRSDDPVSIMFVCMGNICRSPLAHGIFENLIREADMEHHFEIVSSGTGAWHVGERPDSRMRRTAWEHGISLDHLRAQQFRSTDLGSYDHIYVMDRQNLRAVLRHDKRGRYRSKVELFRAHDPIPDSMELPDPYYNGRFDEVYEIVDRTCRALLRRLMREHRLVQ